MKTYTTRRYVEFVDYGPRIPGEPFWPTFEVRRFEENDLGERRLVGRQQLTPDKEGRYSISAEVVT